MKKININKITDTGNPNFIKRAMSKSVKLLYKNDEFIPTLLIVACGIDVSSGGNKSKYLKLLEENFPDLCSELGAIIFYQKYRNGIVHFLSPKKGFGIDRDTSMQGKYIEESEVIETKQKIISLNIDKLYSDFTKFMQQEIKIVKGE